MPPTRVLIVCDDPWSRAGLAAALAGEEGLEVVGQLGEDGDFSAWNADALLWDLALTKGGPEGLEVPALVLVSDEDEARQALSSGARGVLSRVSQPEVLSAALQAVARGLAVLEPALLASLLPVPGEPPPPAEELTARELEVLQLLSLGLSNKAIAGRLGFSEHTAKFHVAQILGKLGVESRTEAVVRAVQLGLIIL